MKATKSVTATLAVLFVVTANASTLELSFEHHAAVVTEGQKRIPLRVRFIDERLIASVKLDVYALPQKPSTHAYLHELQRLSEQTWWQKLDWRIRDTQGGTRAVHAQLMKASRRERTDTTVPTVSYRADFDLGVLPSGDYTVQVAMEGLESGRFPLAVRTGREPEVRDVYLLEKARKSRDWSEFKSLQLERVRLDPTKAGALLELAHRSLEFGTLDETHAYFDRAATTMERNIAEWAKVNPADAKRQAHGVDDAVRQIRALQRVLPDYFAHRATWRVAIETGTGRYVIRTRRTNEVVRRVQ